MTGLHNLPDDLLLQIGASLDKDNLLELALSTRRLR